MTDSYLQDIAVWSIPPNTNWGGISSRGETTVKSLTEATESAIWEHIAIANIRKKLFNGGLSILNVFRQSGIEGDEVVDYSNLITAMRNARNVAQNLLPEMGAQESIIPTHISVQKHFLSAANDISKDWVLSLTTLQWSSPANDPSFKQAA